VRSENELVEIVVDDNGPGIPLAAREAVFSAFHRAESSRNRPTGRRRVAEARRYRIEDERALLCQRPQEIVLYRRRCQDALRRSYSGHHSWKYAQATKAVLTERTHNLWSGDARTSAGSSLHQTNGHCLERPDL
jgi:hypothetical protein